MKEKIKKIIRYWLLVNMVLAIYDTFIRLINWIVPDLIYSFCWIMIFYWSADKFKKEGVKKWELILATLIALYALFIIIFAFLSLYDRTF